MADTKEYKDLFNQSGVPKRLIVSFPSLSVTLRNEDIVEESMEIIERLCTESELRFGSCEATIFKLRIIGNVIPLIGETCVVSMYVGDIAEPLELGTFTVASDKPTADRKYRDIVAYDAMDKIINADVLAWYNSILPNPDSTTTLRAFRDSFMGHFGLEQEEITLPNDEMVVERTIDPEELSGKVVMKAIGEINGCFGHIGRNGKVRYIFLPEIVTGLYPSDELYPSEDLFPRDASGTEKISQHTYISCKYEDYTTKRIGKLQIRKEENDIGCIIGNGENSYIIEDNFLVYGKSAAELEIIGQKLFDIISVVWFRPASAKAIGNPCLEVGAGIRMITQHEIVETYILERTLKGIQALSDSYEAQGAETYSDNVNDVQKMVKQLKNKTNVLIRTVDQTILRIEDLDKGLSSQITQTADAIEAEVKRAGEAEAALSLRADGIALSVTNLDSKLSTRIATNADEIALEAQRAKSAESALRLRADSIELSISDFEEEYKSDIQALAGQISLRVTSAQAQSMIDISLESITIEADQINLNGYVSAGGGNFTIDENGNLKLVGHYSTVEIGEGVEVSGSNSQAVYSSLGVWFRYGGSTVGRMIYDSTSGNIKIITNVGDLLLNGKRVLTTSDLADIEARLSALEG